MTKQLEIFAAKFPAAYGFTIRKAGGILRRFPYRPVRQGESEVDGPEWLVVRPSKIPNSGNGLFTTQFCAKGTSLCEYKGTKLSGLQLLRTPDWTYIANYGSEFFIDAREHPRVKGRFVNHNFDASTWNVDWEYRDKRIFLVASRDVQPEEELYTDYGPSYWANYEYWNGWAS